MILLQFFLNVMHNFSFERRILIMYKKFYYRHIFFLMYKEKVLSKNLFLIEKHNRKEIKNTFFKKLYSCGGFHKYNPKNFQKFNNELLRID